MYSWIPGVSLWAVSFLLWIVLSSSWFWMSLVSHWMFIFATVCATVSDNSYFVGADRCMDCVDILMSMLFTMATVLLFIMQLSFLLLQTLLSALLILIFLTLSESVAPSTDCLLHWTVCSVNHSSFCFFVTNITFYWLFISCWWWYSYWPVFKPSHHYYYLLFLALWAFHAHLILWIHWQVRWIYVLHVTHCFLTIFLRSSLAMTGVALQLLSVLDMLHPVFVTCILHVLPLWPSDTKSNYCPVHPWSSVFVLHCYSSSCKQKGIFAQVYLPMSALSSLFESAV